MATKIGMSSNALVRLGDSPISSFDGGGAGAQALANLYESTYLNLVTSNTWSFARKQLSLSQNVLSPTFDNYAYSYNLPSDMLIAHGLRSNAEYKIYKGNLLYTNDSVAEFEYFARPDEGDIPAFFEVLVEITLAARAAMAVTDRNTLAAEMNSLASKQLLIAMGIDAHNDTNEAVRSSPFTEVRG
jgi:hypothetical protein